VMEARAIAVAAWRLGAGRARKEDPVDFGAGIDLHVKPGERVRAGQPVMTLRTSDEAKFARAHEALEGALSYGSEALPPRPLVIDRIT
ncbi:MAG: thymidine phosphorylase, partial [Propionibacteriaceae bacterium]